LFIYYLIPNFINYGTTKHFVRFGLSIVNSGKNRKTGVSIQKGIAAGFNLFNKQHYQQVEFYVMDDKENSTIVSENINQLVKFYDVFGILGSWNVYSNLTIQNYLNTNNINLPFIGPMTGSTILRYNYNKNTILIRPSYLSELECIFNYCETHTTFRNFSFFYRNNEYINPIFRDLESLIIKNGKFNMISYGFNTNNNTDLLPALCNIFNVKDPYNLPPGKINTKIEFIIINSFENDVIEFILYCQKYVPHVWIFILTSLDYHFLNNLKSFQNIYKIFIIPFFDTPNNDQLMKAVERDKNQGDDINPYYLDGYFTGRLISLVLEYMNNKKIPMTRTNFINCFYTIKNFNIEGYRLGPYIYNDSCVQNISGLQEVYLTKYNGENFTQIFKYSTPQKNCFKLF